MPLPALGLLPYAHYTLFSELPPEEVRAVFTKLVLPPEQMRKVWGPNYVGRVSGDVFTLQKRIIATRGNVLNTLHIRLEASGAGTLVEVRTNWGRTPWVIMIPMLFFFAAFPLFHLVSGLLSGEIRSWNIFSTLALIMIIGGGTGVAYIPLLLQFHYHRHKDQRFWKKALQAV